jgi:hypothetical protein
MPLTLLAPWFLAGLALLAVPIVVHLTNRERRQPVPFPSLMFLRRVPHRTVRRRRLRHLLLFALRCLAVVLLALAFARPFLDRRGAARRGAGPAGREVVVLLDRSYSMGAGDRWARATAAARRVADGLAPGDRATLVLFDEQPAVAVRATGDAEALRAAVARARVGSGATRYDPALALAANVLATSELAGREAVLITDFQRAGWQGSDEARLPAGAALTTVDAGGGVADGNLAVTSVDLARDVENGRERITTTARLVNAGAARPRDVAAQLLVDGRVVDARQARVAPDGAATVTFAPVALAEGWTRATVRAGSDALPADNAFHFAVSRGQVVSALVVDKRSARPDASLYLRRALSVGDRSPFRVSIARAGSLRAEDFAGRSLVVLNDAPPDAAAARLLAAHVRRGAGLLVVLGDASGAAAWPSDAAALLPARVGDVVDRTDQGGTRLATVDRAHPVFAPFAAPRSGDLSAARVLRYRALVPAADAGVLARFADGSPALVERTVGAGRVLMWASTLDNFWTDLAVQPVFVPLVHQLAKHTANFRDARPWLTVGQTADLSTAGASAGEWVVETPSGRTEPLSAASGAAPALTASEQGFYTVRRADGRVAPLTVAVNLDAAEADPARVDPGEVARAVAPDPRAAPSAAAQAEGASRQDEERRQSAWWYVLATALVVLAAETLLSNRLSRAPRAARRPWQREPATDASATGARAEGSWNRPSGTRRSA